MILGAYEHFAVYNDKSFSQTHSKICFEPQKSINNGGPNFSLDLTFIKVYFIFNYVGLGKGHMYLGAGAPRAQKKVSDVLEMRVTAGVKHPTRLLGTKHIHLQE